jgi:hypothetical protein
MRCAVCGAENPPGLCFCEQCAAPLGAQEAAGPAASGQTCPRCGAHNRAGLRFCEQCAAPLGAQEAATPAPSSQVCPRCGTENPPGLRFCEQCAAPLDGQEAAIPARRPVPLSPAAPGPPAPQFQRRTVPEGRHRVRHVRWGWAVGLLGAVALLAVAALIALPAVLPAAGLGPMTADRAERIAAQIVADAFPEFAGKPASVRELVGFDGQAQFVVSYSYLAQVSAQGRTIEIPRILVIEVSRDGKDVYVTESN